MNEYSFNIDNVFNVFSSAPLDLILAKYQINNYYYLNQIHSDIVLIADNNYVNNTDGDALITNEVNKPLVIRTADCVSIILYDRVNKVLAVIHSGWKGTLNKIVLNALNIMKEKYHCQVENIASYLYPSIRKCHFEVEKDVYDIFKNRLVNIDNYTSNKGIKYYIDLQKIIIADLAAAGVNNINDANTCTYCNHNDFYSYRYNKTDKRNYLIAYIKE